MSGPEIKYEPPPKLLIVSCARWGVNRALNFPFNFEIRNPKFEVS